jgi:ubiquinone biosynthesis protein COQ9
VAAADRSESAGVANENSGEETQEAHITASTYTLANIYLGAVQKGIPLERVQQLAITDAKYRNFLPRLQSFLKERLPSSVDISQHIHSQTMVCAIP